MKWFLLVCLSFGFTTGTFGQWFSTEALDTLEVHTDLATCLANPDSVYILDLSHSRLKAFPEEVLLLPNLQILRLNRNKIDSIPDRIAELKYLQVIELERNRIETIPLGLCRIDSLREIYLGDNEIVRIPDEIGDLTALEVLSLWSNIVGYYPTNLNELSRLRLLDLLNIEMNAEEQGRVRDMLPHTSITFSPPCDCEFEDPWDTPPIDSDGEH